MKKGIDISEHNGNIDFTKVKQVNIEFVIIRVGWIGNKNNHTLDKQFRNYILHCIDNAIPYGIYVYNYCNSVETLRSGVNWLFEQLKGIAIMPYYPIFLDMEDNSISNLSKENLTNQCLEFCKMVEQRGYKAGVYANKYWFTNKIDVSKLSNYKIWLAEWNGKQNHTAPFKVDLWQYTSKGQVNGINSRVDMNYCLNCENINVENITGERGDFDLKIYQNGTTIEPVYQDTTCKTQIGYLNPHETAECYGIVNNLALVVYNKDRANYKKVGFCKWLGGIK